MYPHTKKRFVRRGCVSCMGSADVSRISRSVDLAPSYVSDHQDKLNSWSHA